MNIFPDSYRTTVHFLCTKKCCLFMCINCWKLYIYMELYECIYVPSTKFIFAKFSRWSFYFTFSLIKTKFRLFYPANYPFKTGGSYYRPNGWLIEQGNFCFLKIRSLLPTIVYSRRRIGGTPPKIEGNWL